MDPMCDDAGIAAYLGALDSCFRARFDLADALLRRLGCRWRLSDPLWRCVGSPVVPGPGAGSQIGCGGGAGVAISDAPLAAHLLAQLQAGFAEAAPFWHVHHYADPDTPFFSFVYQLADEPGNALEEAMRLLAGQLREDPATAAAMAGVSHVEWWAHRRPPWAAHQLHFDANEALMRQGLDMYRLLHPALSSVLYLTAQGGPTIILDQTAHRGLAAASQPSAAASQRGAGAQLLAERAWLVQPKAGRFAVWSGDLLHGVLPGAGWPDGDEAAGDQGPDGEPSRITLIMAWWPGDPRQQAGMPPPPQPQQQEQPQQQHPPNAPAQQLGPLMTTPSATSNNWLAPLAPGGGGGGGSAAAAAAAAAGPHPCLLLLPCVAPAWQWVDPEDGSNGCQALENAPLPPLRFFLRDARDVCRAYVPE